MYDLHTHTLHSDGKNTVEEMCRSAIDKGMNGLAITDHADMDRFVEQDALARMERAIADITAAKPTVADKLTLLCGVELGEYLIDPDNAERILALDGFDVVLYSEHFVPGLRWDKPYSRILFDDNVTDAEVDEYMARYFDTVARTADKFDYDVLAHLTCPARYITGRYHRPTDIWRYRDVVTDILKTVIARDIALEINTCGKCCQSFSYYDAQNEELLALYARLGGKRVTLGSDAHAVGGIGRGFEDTKALLFRYGFDRYYYYRNRQPIAIPIL